MAMSIPEGAEFEQLKLRVRRLELMHMSFGTTEHHFTRGGDIDAERRRVAEERAGS